MPDVKEAATPETNFKIEKVRFHYAFSFAFSRLPLGEPLDKEDGAEKLGRFLEKGLKQIAGNEKLDINWHESEEDEPKETRSSIYIPFHHLSISYSKNEANWLKANLGVLGTGLVGYHIAIFESGMGIVWIILEPETALDINAIIPALSRDSIPVVKMETAKDIFDEPKEIHQLFYAKIEKLKDDINLLINTLKTKSQKILLAKNPSISNSDDKFKVHWIDIEEIDIEEKEEKNLLWFDENRRFEEPSIACIIKVDKDTLKSIDLDEPGRKKIESCISSILHCIDPSYLDDSHTLEHSSQELRNLYPDKRFRVFMHSNCMLVMHSESFTDAIYHNFSYGLFRCHCALRGPWHMASIINEQLDNQIEKLYCQFGREDELINERSIAEMQKAIIKIKGGFLVGLATEDPLVLSIGLTPLAPLYEVGYKIYKMEELKVIVKYKLKEIDNLFNMISSYKYRARFIKPEKKKYDKAIFTLIGCLLLAIPLLLNKLVLNYFNSCFVQILFIIIFLFIAIVFILYGLQRVKISRK